MVTEEIRDSIILESLVVINRRVILEAIEIWDRREVSGVRFDSWIEWYNKVRWEELVRNN